MSSSSPGRNNGRSTPPPLDPTNGNNQTPEPAANVSAGEKEKSGKKSSAISEKVGFFEQVWRRRRSRSSGKKDKSAKKEAGLAADDRQSRIERAYYGKRDVNSIKKFHFKIFINIHSILRPLFTDM